MDESDEERTVDWTTVIVDVCNYKQRSKSARELDMYSHQEENVISIGLILHHWSWFLSCHVYTYSPKGGKYETYVIEREAVIQYKAQKRIVMSMLEVLLVMSIVTVGGWRAQPLSQVDSHPFITNAKQRREFTL